MQNKEVEARLRSLLDTIKEMASLMGEGLLENDRFHKSKDQIETELTTLGKDLDERDSLKIKKVLPVWKNMPKSGGFATVSTFQSIIPINQLLLELLVKYGKPQTIPLPKNEIIIPAGREFEGKQYLRSILNQAISEILIRDNYLRAEILDILSEYVIEKPQLTIRLLTWDGNRLPAFRIHYNSFTKLYKSVEARYLPSSLKDHPRYILIDNQKLFTPDHSLDQWGVSTVNIHEHADQNDVLRIKGSLENEWISAIGV